VNQLQVRSRDGFSCALIAIIVLCSLLGSSSFIASLSGPAYAQPRGVPLVPAKAANASIVERDTPHFLGMQWIGTGSGSYSGNASNANVEVEGPTNETAVLYPRVEIAVTGGGSVSYSYGSQSGVVPGGTTGIFYLPLGTQILFSAAPSSFVNEFAGWSGSYNGTASDIKVTVSGPTSFTAGFSFNYAAAGGIAVAVFGIPVIGLLIYRRRPSKSQTGQTNPAPATRSDAPSTPAQFSPALPTSGGFHGAEGIELPKAERVTTPPPQLEPSEKQAPTSQMKQAPPWPVGGVVQTRPSEASGSHNADVQTSQSEGLVCHKCSKRLGKKPFKCGACGSLFCPQHAAWNRHECPAMG
jgi:hypothetical protein